VQSSSTSWRVGMRSRIPLVRAPLVMLIPVGVALAAGARLENLRMLPRTMIDGPAGRLFVDDGGDGLTPAVFIHSLAGNTTQWMPQLSHVRRTRRAVALDLRGHGRSDAPRDGRYDLDAYAADVHGALDALRIPRAVLVGHSMGGGVAVAFAGRWPEQAAGLLLVDPIDDPSKRPADQGFEAFLGRLEGPEYATVIADYWTQILQHGQPSVRQKVLDDLKRTPKETVIATMRAMSGFNAESALTRYPGPMLTITTPLNEFPNSLHNVVQGLRQEKMSDVSHWLQLDRPTEFNAALDRFLAVVDKRH
jgi:pimeloyl-ACP methyl ester carboxylesterase